MARQVKLTVVLLLATLLSLFPVPGILAADENLFIMKGDLHVHTTFSHDGEQIPAQVIAASITAGYDFVAFTEHNTTAHLKKDHSTEQMLVIAGYEHTTPVAHMNIYGIRDIPKKADINTKEEMEEYLTPLREQGAIIQLNHPNSSNYYSRFGYDIDFDFLEILNGSFSKDDHKTLNDYQTLLCEGRRLIATGGTDVHRNYTVREVYNNVLVRERSEEAVLEGLLAGRNFVTVKPDGPVISMECDGVIMGGTVSYAENQKVTVTIDNMEAHTIVRIYTSNGLTLEEVFQPINAGKYLVEVPTEGVTFVRVEVWYDNARLCAFSNPIYIER